MFILVLFGYKQFKVFTIDCLGQTLLDCIWAQAIKEMQKLLVLKDEQHNKDLKAATSKINSNEKRTNTINQQLQDEGLYDPNKKDDKKGAKAPPPKKGKEVVPGNPLEAEKMDLQKETEKLQEAVIKYQEKLTKLKAISDKYKDLNESYAHNQLVIELLDKTGERKFIKTKLDQRGDQFLSEKGTYILGYIQPPPTPDDEEQVLAVEIEGFIVRSVDEDVGAVDEPLLQPAVGKKDDKKKKGKK